MKHQIIPCEDQTENPAIDRNNPLAAATAIELQFPKTFSKKAWRVIRYFEGAMYLYSYKGKFVATDESLELTEYGDGSNETPYGAPRFVCDTLNELEAILEDLADLYDASGDIPGWETGKPHEIPKVSLQGGSPNILITLVKSGQFIGVKTYCRKLGSRGRFLISQGILRELMDSPIGTTKYEEDCGDCVKLVRLADALHVSFVWLNTYGDGSVRGNRQDFGVPLSKINLVLDSADIVKHLYLPPAPHAEIDAHSVADVIHEITQNKRLRRAFSKAMRDSFRWQGEQVTLYRDVRHSFFFTTRSGFPKCGGLILHEGERNGYPYIYYSIHT